MTDIKKKLKGLPDSPGVYKFYNSNGLLIYVGKSVSIRKRVSSYFSKSDLGPKTNKLVSEISKIDCIKVFSEFEALLLEAHLIRTNQPFYNIQAKDDKSPIYIKVSKDPIPMISTTRLTGVKKGEFIKGPFQSSKATRQILNEVRKIFPYCHHKNPKKPCLYVHLGLCPYPYSGEDAKKEYQLTIKKIKSLLGGKTNYLTKILISEMKRLSKNQEFEKANAVKKQIEKLESLKNSFHSPREFLERPTLVDDLNQIRLHDLKKILGLPHMPKRIECYDISNIQGKMATGSMVVFIAGQAAQDQYRRFKIKFTDTPNDFEMMREVLSRRFKNNWPKPDLIIIDGGKGQLSTALSIQKKYNFQTYIISLAKRIEEIFTPDSKESIKLPPNSPARLLVQSARDEAHRFAITYHRLLRSKNLKSGK